MVLLRKVAHLELCALALDALADESFGMETKSELVGDISMSFRVRVAVEVRKPFGSASNTNTSVFCFDLLFGVVKTIGQIVQELLEN